MRRGAPKPVLDVTAPPLVATDAEFAAVLDALDGVEAYALDTEFHRERTYFPKLALLQLAWDGGMAVVDPLAVDIAPLARVLRGPAVAVLHAASQDLEVLELACGTVPERLVDTQIAAGFVGMSTPSLSDLHERRLGTALPKGDRLTDWLQRPLRPEQLRYAASDVADLLPLWRDLAAELERRGRLTWALDECAILLGRARGGRRPEEAYLRVKEVRQLRGRGLAVAREVAAWRERRAATLDIPVRHVLSDLAVAGLAQRAPTRAEDLRGIRGLDERSLRPAVLEDLLAAIRRGVDAPPPEPPSTATNAVDSEFRGAIGLLSSWVSQLARDLHLDPTLLATRNDLEDLLRHRPTGRLLEGWRADLVGRQVEALLRGEASLVFDAGRLRLEERAGRPFGSTADDEDETR